MPLRGVSLDEDDHSAQPQIDKQKWYLMLFHLLNCSSGVHVLHCLDSDHLGLVLPLK